MHIPCYLSITENDLPCSINDFVYLSCWPPYFIWPFMYLGFDLGFIGVWSLVSILHIIFIIKCNPKCFFCHSHMGNRTHDLGTNHLAHRSRLLYHHTNYLNKNEVYQCVVANPTYVYISRSNAFLINWVTRLGQRPLASSPYWKLKCAIIWCLITL